jgi:hypothetical protein
MTLSEVEWVRVCDTAGRLKAPRLKAPSEVEGLTLAATTTLMMAGLKLVSLRGRHPTEKRISRT